MNDSVSDENQDDFNESERWFDSSIARMVESCPVAITLQSSLNQHAINKLASAFGHCYIMNWKRFASSHLKLTPADIQNIHEDNSKRCLKVSKNFPCQFTSGFL